MRLAELITADRIVVPLPSGTLTAAAWALVERLVAAGAVHNPERLRQRVLEERAEDIVAMGDRAFLLHYRSDAVRELTVALGTAPTPICRELGDGNRQCARIVLLIVAPPRLAARYLQVVGAFARVLSRSETVDQVLAQESPDALAAIESLQTHSLPAHLTVRDIMTEAPRTAAADTALRDAAADMVRTGVGGLPVVDDHGRVVGLLSERELLRHLLSSQVMGEAGERPRSAGGNTRRAVRDVMTRQVLCVSPEQPLAEVASLMANKDVDRVPVVSEGRLVGLLTRGDIVRKLIGS